MSVELPRRLFNVDEFERMVEVGILGPDDRVELLDGEVVEMAPIGSRHAACVKRLNRILSRALSDRAVIGVQDPVRLPPRSEPEPDLTISRPRDDFYASAHPGPGDIHLVVEVAEATVLRDRNRKIPLYAGAGVPEAWLVDLGAAQIEVHRTPEAGGYHDVTVVGREQSISPLAFPDVAIEMDEILG